MPEGPGVIALERKIDRVLELLEDAFLSSGELRDVLRIKALYRSGRIEDKTVSLEDVLREIQ